MDQVLSLSGAVLVLAAYAGNQFGMIDRTHWLYNAMNVIGALALTVVGVRIQQWGFVLLEGVWTVLSVGPLIRTLRRS